MTERILMAIDVEARRLLRLNQGETAELLGVNVRTVQRWDAGRSTPSHLDYQGLARATFPLNPTLAARLAVTGGTTLAALGLVAQPPATSAKPPAVPLELVIDSVLCAAAIAVDMKPLEIKPGIIAAFRRARQLGLDLEAAEKALVGAEAASAGSPSIAAKAPKK